MRDEDGFEFRVLRAEWRVVLRAVDQYGAPAGQPEILSAWPTFEQARKDLPNHAIPDKFVPERWLPKVGANGSFLQVAVMFGETPVTDPAALRALLERALADTDPSPGP